MSIRSLRGLPDESQTIDTTSRVIDRFMDQLEADNARAAQQGTRQGAR